MRVRPDTSLRRTGKSAEVIDGKEVALAPLHKRVRKPLKTKQIDG